MTKKPREEISYEDIYENLDVKAKREIKFSGDHKFNINKEECLTSSCPLIYLDQNNFSSEDVDYCLDEYDLKNFDFENVDLDAFEFAIDRLEKDFHENLKTEIKEKFIKLEPEDRCDICTFEEIDDNLILICQGCGISVHRDCYGSSYDEDEVFICLSCYYFYLNPVCMFCPEKGGLMKMTTDCRWGHVTCVLFNEFLDFDNPNSKEPIDLSRYKECQGSCIFCEDTFGTKVQCNYGLCPNFYHVSCGLDKIYFDMNNNVTYCDEHNPQKSKSIFSNSHNFLKSVVGYRKLSNPPLIRKKNPLSKSKNTILMEILNTKPYVSDSVFSLIFKKDYFKDKKALEKICEYWKQRKQKDTSLRMPQLNLFFDL
ncbi:Bromodomain-containing protein 1 [Nosema bombycis CQ1]|uniref:Bromodomain-containing protein 1 n=1 Tax=Nosema bombycis (strain CQ1 / CVCC 102059) TaxID=578461 RepID=R0MLK5_NOSB1|nr:Bromodomain-containing protein 1 [Nosema bombycis CQ1]|eukprot:EOB13713.1 Bromodomain-containing protein 1 [Nosema bombycis CQ1]